MIRNTLSLFFFFFNDTATTEIYTVSYTLSLHDALPISDWMPRSAPHSSRRCGRCSARSEEHTSELQSQLTISYAVFCLKKKKEQRDEAARDLGGDLPQRELAARSGGTLDFFFNDPATTEIYTVSYTLSLHDALPISWVSRIAPTITRNNSPAASSNAWRSRSEEHTSELQSQLTISYAVFCLKKKKKKKIKKIAVHIDHKKKK